MSIFVFLDLERFGIQVFQRFEIEGFGKFDDAFLLILQGLEVPGHVFWLEGLGLGGTPFLAWKARAWRAVFVRLKESGFNDAELFALKI